MLYTLALLPRARRQTAELSDWWNEHRPEAPSMFDDELNDVLLSLRELPERGFARAGGLRVIVMPRTKNLVFYRVRPRALRVEIVMVRRA